MAINVSGESQSEGRLVLTPIDTPSYREFLAKILGAVSLAEDVVESILVEVGTEAEHAWIRARTASGDVSTSIEVELTSEVRDAMQGLLATHRDAIRDDLKLGLAKTIVAGLSAGDK